ncbi:hypothetical protein LCGC14_0232220 [marine sediment metagenome]|uniref:Uncharacterized protein n=1 Tax=marine sediment metagenome TaxID=412755 RepID=A0A0F9UEL0_9ZZZZ
MAKQTKICGEMHLHEVDPRLVMAEFAKAVAMGSPELVRFVMRNGDVYAFKIDCISTHVVAEPQTATLSFEAIVKDIIVQEF